MPRAVWKQLTLTFFNPHGWQACDTRLRGRASDEGAGGGVDMLAKLAAILTDDGGESEDFTSWGLWEYRIEYFEEIGGWFKPNPENTGNEEGWYAASASQTEGVTVNL